MVAKPEFLDHFIFNSDYPVDKIVWLYEGQYTTPSGNTIQNIYIPIQELLNSKYTIFIKGAVTVDDWATSIMIGTRYSRSGKNASVSMNWESGTNARIHLSSDLRSYPSKTAKYRLWGVVRDDIQQAVDYPKNSSTSKAKLIFNTELNYPRLYKDGVAMSGETVEHNLGKIPYVDYWYISKYPSTITPASLSTSWSYAPGGHFGNAITSEPTIRATDKTLTFRQIVVNGNETRDLYYYYRIYA